MNDFKIVESDEQDCEVGLKHSTYCEEIDDFKIIESDEPPEGLLGEHSKHPLYCDEIDRLKNIKIIDLPNFDTETGISYGVISQHSISPYVIDDIINGGVDLYYESAKDAFESDLKAAIIEVMNNHNICSMRGNPEIDIDGYLDEFNDSYQNDEHHWFYEDKEYIFDFSNDLVAVYICKSPYYTYCRGCSPCCPGAGDLDSIITRDDYDHTEFNSMSWGGAKKAYCLPNDYFENHKAPYVYFKVCSDIPENVVDDAAQRNDQ